MTPAVVAARRAGVACRVLEYPHDTASRAFGLEAANALGVDAAQVFKTLVVAESGGELLVAVIPAAARLDLKGLASAVGAKKAALADPPAAERATGYVVGGISPLGQRRRLRTFLDESALTYEEIYVSAGKRGLEIALHPLDLVRLTQAAVNRNAR